MRGPPEPGTPSLGGADARLAASMSTVRAQAARGFPEDSAARSTSRYSLPDQRMVRRSSAASSALGGRPRTAFFT